jgi:hypothetical protein
MKHKQFTLRALFVWVAIAAVASFLVLVVLEIERSRRHAHQRAVFNAITEGRMRLDEAPEWFTEQDYQRLLAKEA